MLAKLKKSLTRMCVIYTVIISIMFILGWAVSDSASLFVPTPSKALLILLFCAILGFASLLLSEHGTKPIKLILHFAVCTIAFVLTFLVGGGFPITGPTSIVAYLIFVILYFIVMLVRYVIYRKNNCKTVEDHEYTPVFK